MKGYLSEKTETLLHERKILLDKAELIAFNIQDLTKKITMSLFNSLAGKKIRFEEENTVRCQDNKSNTYNQMPSNEEFSIVEARVSNTANDIAYVCKGNQSGKMYTIYQEEFQSFNFIN